MRGYQKNLLIGLFGLAALGGFSWWASAADTDDGISEATDEAIASDDNLGGKDNNISFIVTNAVAKAKNKVDSSGKAKDIGNKTKTNYNDGVGDTNENSVVVEAGSKVDKVYNIIIQK